jgi:hypothetical protein
MAIMTDERLTELTPEQDAQIAPWAEQWQRICLSCEPIDAAGFEAATIECYKAAGLAPPKRFVFVGSPWAAVTQGPVEGFRLEFGREPTPEERVAVIKDNWNCCLGGHLWAAWPAWQQFFIQVCGVKLDEADLAAANAYAKTAQCAGWWWLHTDVVFVSDRPRELHLDDAGNLHCETGPAMAWRDGEVEYWLHGVSVPAEWITDTANVPPALALTWPNIEQRAQLAMLLGWHRVLEGLPVTVLDSDPNPHIGTLFDVTLPGIAEPQRFLRVACPTGRTFVLSVSNDSCSALEAGAASFRVSPDVYRKLKAQS